jgi:hypothetical protein|eukprot:7391571-Prymnesium_polylepis.2
MARSNGVGYPPEKGLRVCIPGLSTKIEVRKALRFPALVQKLKTEICKKKPSERSPAAVRFLQLAREDQMPSCQPGKRRTNCTWPLLASPIRF